MTYRSPAGLAAAVALLAAAPAAAAEPVTVDLRIEGATSTLFEGRVTTGVRPFRFTDERKRHRCDGTAALGGDNARPAPTRGAALAAAARRARFELTGTWHPDFGASMTRVAGESVAYDPATGRYLAEFENGELAQLGACADDVEDGDEVLFAFATGSERVLALAGPDHARPGQPVNVRVTDAGTGAPVAGADVGGVRTDAGGEATVGPFTATGFSDLKATGDGAIRSNRLRICVTDGAEHSCDTTAPRVRIAGIRDGERLRRARAPRRLRGTVDEDFAGVRTVKLRLARRVKGRCRPFSGARERFVGRPCRKRRAFRVGDGAVWSYRLPQRLRRGRYVLHAIAVDRAGNRDRTRVAFRVG